MSNTSKINLKGWIPCVEKMPEIGKRVLIHCDSDNEPLIGAFILKELPNGTYLQYWELDNCDFNGINPPTLDLIEIDFWQPLPKAPKKQI